MQKGRNGIGPASRALGGLVVSGGPHPLHPSVGWPEPCDITLHFNFLFESF